MARRLLALVLQLFGIGAPRSGAGDRHRPVHLRPTKWKPAFPRAASSSLSLSAPRGRRPPAPGGASLDSAAVLLDAAVGAGTGYSQARYYTSLGLFVLYVPRLCSLIKRSVKSKLGLMHAQGKETGSFVEGGRHDRKMYRIHVFLYDELRMLPEKGDG